MLIQQRSESRFLIKSALQKVKDSSLIQHSETKISYYINAHRVRVLISSTIKGKDFSLKSLWLCVLLSLHFVYTLARTLSEGITLKIESSRSTDRSKLNGMIRATCNTYHGRDLPAVRKKA